VQMLSSPISTATTRRIRATIAKWGLSLLAALIPLWASAGCGHAEPDSEETDNAVGAAAIDPEIELRLGVLDTHQGVVQGVVEVRTLDGAVVATRTISNSEPPADLAQMMVAGTKDEDGYVFTDVAGGQGDGQLEVRYRYIKRYQVGADAEEGGADPVEAEPVEATDVQLTPDFVALLNEQSGPAHADLYLRLRERFSTQLRPASLSGSASLAGAEEEYEQRHAAIAARKAEADELQSEVKAALEALGADDVSGFWTSNAVSARVPRSSLAAIASIEGLEVVSVDLEGAPQSSTQWDGADMKATGGLNAGLYHDAGYDGQGYSDAGGLLMKIGFFGTLGYFDHPGFQDTGTLYDRAIVFDCTQSPCVANQSAASGTFAHDLKCAGLAAGSVRDGQLSGLTSTQQLERSGVAEEPSMFFLEGTNGTHAKRAIELAIDLELDVIESSQQFGAAVCQGYGTIDMEESIYEAQLANILVVQSAGNYGFGGACNVVHPGDTPSAFAVRGLGSETNTCTSSNYATCPVWSGTSRGGVDATVNGATQSGAISAVSAMVPACPQYYYIDSSPWIHTYPSGPLGTGCGTSYAAPQVAGAAILMKDFFLANDYGFIGIEGRPFAVLLAMTDREFPGPFGAGKTSVGFHPVWGGGRFQMRKFDSSDHAGVFGWESYSHLFTADNETVEHNLWGSVAEPSTLNQLKVYSVFFEKDSLNMAKIDMRVLAGNCAGSSLGLDNSYDVKKMVRTGTAARSQQTCARLQASHLPTGVQRRAHVFAYYSAATSMR